MAAREVIYVGWIPVRKSDARHLRRLGVQGEMIWNAGKRCFEHCEMTEDVVRQLYDAAHLYRYKSFTAVYKDTGEQLPPELQKYWGGIETEEERAERERKYRR